MAKITMTQMLFLRAIYGMPAGATAPAILATVREETGFDINHGHTPLMHLLRQRYITVRKIPRAGHPRDEPHCFYGITPAGRALLREYSVHKLRHPSRPPSDDLDKFCERIAPRVAEMIQRAEPQPERKVLVKATVDELLKPEPRKRNPRLPQHRPATRKECKAAGVPLWQRWGRHA